MKKQKLKKKKKKGKHQKSKYLTGGESPVRASSLGKNMGNHNGSASQMELF